MSFLLKGKSLFLPLLKAALLPDKSQMAFSLSFLPLLAECLGPLWSCSFCGRPRVASWQLRLEAIWTVQYLKQSEAYEIGRVTNSYQRPEIWLGNVWKPTLAINLHKFKILRHDLILTEVASFVLHWKFKRLFELFFTPLFQTVMFLFSEEDDAHFKENSSKLCPNILKTRSWAGPVKTECSYLEEHIYHKKLAEQKWLKNEATSWSASGICVSGNVVFLIGDQHRKLHVMGSTHWFAQSLHRFF